MAAIRRALAETTDRLLRSRLLPAYIEIMLATGDVSAAGEGARDLAEIAVRSRKAAMDNPLDLARTIRIRGPSGFATCTGLRSMKSSRPAMYPFP